MSTESLDKPNYTSLTLWDIDREFQTAYDAYEQWLSKNRPRRRKWECFGSRNQDDELGKVLCLGRQVKEIMEDGQDCFGKKFERGDSKLRRQKHKHTMLTTLMDPFLTSYSYMQYDPRISTPSCPARSHRPSSRRVHVSHARSNPPRHPSYDCKVHPSDLPPCSP